MNASTIPGDTPSRRWFVRVMRTPMVDLLRLRLTARLDLKGIIAAADLPEPLRRTVHSVIRATRLWRSEKVDVAHELIDHFTDGLAAGRSAEALIESFGDLKQAARLIRRAKRRGRPLLWRMWGRGVQMVKLAVAAVVLVYLALLLRFQWAKPTVTWNYMAQINAQAAAVPANDRAWPLYREALMKLEPLPEGAKREFTLSRPGDESWPDLAAYLQRNSKTLELIRQAAARPRLGFRFGDPTDRPLSEFSHPEAMPSESDNPIVVNWRLPHVQQLRDVARLLSADALRASVEGDGSTATADLVAQMRVSEHCRDTAPLLIADLVSLVVFGDSLATLGRILADRPAAFSDAELTDLAHRVGAVAGGGRLRVRLDGERATFKDLWQRIYSGDGHLTADGFETLMELASPPRPGRVPEPEEAQGTRWPDGIGFNLLGSAATAAIAGRREMSAFCDRLLDEAELAHSVPLWEQKEAGVEAELEALGHTRARAIHYLPVVLMMPAVGHASVWVEKITQRRDAALVAIALELYRRRQGSWPDRLERLVPDLLPAVPPDRFDGRPLRYRLVDGRAVLYSIGVDRIDDGGRPCESSLGDASAWRPAKDVGEVRKDGRDVGDWILWPPVNEES